MSIYGVDYSCSISSRKQRINTEAYIIENNQNLFSGDENILNDFFKLQQLIIREDHSDDHEELNTLSKRFHDINAICKQKDSSWTLMHKVAEKGCMMCGCILMTHGANPDINILNALTPRELAIKLGHHDLLQGIQERVTLQETIEYHDCNITCTQMGTRKDNFTTEYEGFIWFGKGKQEHVNILCSVSYEIKQCPTTLSLAFRIECIKQGHEQAYNIIYTGDQKLNTLYITPSITSSYKKSNKDKHYFVKIEKPQPKTAPTSQECIIN